MRINKGRVQAETRIETGDVLRLPPIRISAARSKRAPRRPRRRANFPCCYEDDAVLAIDKPAGVAVHGGSGVSFGVIEQLRTARPAAKFLELVHRLDRETSGILLVAKKRSALTALQDQFRERETGKTYLALVEGAWPANKKVLDTPLAKYLLPDRRWRRRRRVRVVAKDHPDAMRAVTLVRVLAAVHAAGRRRRRCRCWRSPSRPAARTRSACTWPRPGTRLPATTSTASSNATGPCRNAASSACSCMPGGCSSTILRPASELALQADLPPELATLDAAVRHGRAGHPVFRLLLHDRLLLRFDLIAFDWDGTLYDSTQLIVRCIQAAVVDVGGAMPSEHDAAWVIGLGLAEALARAAPDVPREKYPGAGRALPLPLPAAPGRRRCCSTACCRCSMRSRRAAI